MDKVSTNYTRVIKDALTDYVSLVESSSNRDYAVIPVFDDEHNQYLVRKLGWTDKARISKTVLHVALRNNKIWIEEDWTEDGIATYFVNHNVPHQDIVLGFQPPIVRPYGEFAVE